MIRVFQKWTRLEEVFISCRPIDGEEGMGL